MTIRARIKSYLSKIFRDNPNGLSLEEIIEKTAKLEDLEINLLDLSKNSMRNEILEIILNGMAC